MSTCTRRDTRRQGPVGERVHGEHHRDAGCPWPQARGNDEDLRTAGRGPVKLIVNDQEGQAQHVDPESVECVGVP